MVSTIARGHEIPFRLIILGAGFSKPAGLPLGGELLNLVRKKLRLGGRPRRSFEDEIRQWLQIYPSEELSLERVLAYSHRRHYLLLKGSEEFYSHGSPSVVQARRAIQEILTEAMPREVPQAYREFASRLTPHDTVITFNYDTLLERALDAVGKPYSLTPEWWLDSPLTEEGLQYVNVLKMHGSIDWFDRKPYDDYIAAYGPLHDSRMPIKDPIFGPTPYVKAESLSMGKTTKGLGERIISRVVRVPEYEKVIRAPNKPGELSVVPFMLPMAHDKLLGHDPVLDFWWAMQEIVKRETSSITIIGYSMSKHDEYAYEAISTILMEYQEVFCTEAPFFFPHTRQPIQVINRADSPEEIMTNLPFVERSKSRTWNNGFSVQAIEWAFG